MNILLELFFMRFCDFYARYTKESSKLDSKILIYFNNFKHFNAESGIFEILNLLDSAFWIQKLQIFLKF